MLRTVPILRSSTSRTDGNVILRPRDQALQDEVNCMIENQQSPAEFTAAQLNIISERATVAANKLISDQISRLRIIVTAFLCGLGALAVLLYFGVIPWPRLQEIFRENILGVNPSFLSDNYKSIEQLVAATSKTQIVTASPQIKDILHDSVNFTYSGQFKLGPEPALNRVDQIYFYATPLQKVVAYLSILALHDPQAAAVWPTMTR
jgi:hypothetical protein